MTIDDILLLGRVAFVVALFLFLLVLAALLRRELRVRAVSPLERAPGDLLVMEPFDTGLEPGERVALLATTSVGREGANDIVLDDTFISADHAKLMWNGRGWILQDLGSTNGTYVNGKQVRKAAAVKMGDLVEFGRVKMKLVPL